MAEAIGAVLAYAVGVGLSPIPIVAAILVLFSERAKLNGPLFLLGWILGLTVVLTVVAFLATALDVDTSDGAKDGVSWLRIGLGVLLLVAAGRKWQKRPAAGEVPEMPGWMAGIDRIAPARAFGLAMLLSANPKNLALAVGAGTSLAQLGAGTGEVVVALTVFVVVGSAVVIVAVVYAGIGGDRARSGLDDAKAWLTVNNTAVMAVLFVVFGAVLVSQGLGLRD